MVDGAGAGALGEGQRSAEGRGAGQRSQRLCDQAVRHPGISRPRSRLVAPGPGRRASGSRAEVRPADGGPGVSTGAAGRHRSGPDSQGIRRAGAAGAAPGSGHYPAATAQGHLGPDPHRRQSLPADRGRPPAPETGRRPDPTAVHCDRGGGGVSVVGGRVGFSLVLSGLPPSRGEARSHRVHCRSMWERACSRRGPNSHSISLSSGRSHTDPKYRWQSPAPTRSAPAPCRTRRTGTPVSAR